ncbi:MAG TPA: phenylpyruvate tautomerase MIF-related protein [Polyangia bacterium]|nr:phenylpyruvate tautomerase MIF-related protein [Polyangia bacterium]
MPLVQVFTSAPAPAADAQKKLLADLSRLLAESFGKPERWVMTCLQPELAMTFGGTPAAAAFVAVKNIGKMTADDTTKLSGALCERLSAALGVARDRIYIDFADAVGYQWGWNGETFG